MRILVVLCSFLVSTALAETPAERGAYLTMIMGCHDCHTPKKQGPHGEPLLDTERLLSGHPADAPYPTWSPADLQERHALFLGTAMLTGWAGPWGVSFATNLTPDEETGMGAWTEEAFLQALRTGKHQGQPNGRPILTPMPWQVIGQAKEADLKAIWAYLQTIPPIKNRVPLPVPPAGPPPAAK